MKKLVEPKITKLDILKQWCIEKRLFNTIDVKTYGLQNFYTSADVRVRNLASEGFIRAISDDEAVLRGLIKPGNKNLRWYEYGLTDF